MTEHGHMGNPLDHDICKVLVNILVKKQQSVCYFIILYRLSF
jgi:hypothetical protein